MSDLKIQGRVIVVLPPKSGVSKTTGKEWTSQDFVIETEGQYPQSICFSAMGQMVAHIENLKTGQMVNVSFNPRSNRYEKDGVVSYFTSLNVWKIEKEPYNEPTPSINQPASDFESMPIPDGGDLPF
jgi:hypothetical protein